MICGIGTDIVNIKRLDKGREFLNRFIRRCLNENERQQLTHRCFTDISAEILYLAKRFAAKEAVSKALGTGFRDGINLSNIEIFNDALGCPGVKLSGQAEQYMKAKYGDNYRVYLSLSDDYPFAVAFAVIEI